MVFTRALAVIIFLMALVPSTASAQTSTVISHRSASVVSNSPWAEVASSKTEKLNLSDGLYSLNVMAEGLGYVVWVTSTIDVFTKSGAYVETLVDLWQYNFAISLNETANFAISGSADKYYQFSSMIYVSDAVASYSTTLSRITAVPGPEAGAGLGFGLAGALSVWLARRDKRLSRDQE